MKIAQEYKGYYLDVFYKDGVVNGIIQQTQDQLQGLTVEEVVSEFKKKVNLINQGAFYNASFSNDIDMLTKRKILASNSFEMAIWSERGC